MPSVFTDESPNSYDLAIGNSTGLDFTDLLPNGDATARNNTASSADVNIASKLLGNPFPSGMDITTNPGVYNTLVWIPKMGNSAGAGYRQMKVGIRNGTAPSQWYWVVRIESRVGVNDYYPGIQLGFYGNGSYIEVAYTAPQFSSIGSAVYTMELTRLINGNNYGFTGVLRATTPTTDTVLATLQPQGFIAYWANPGANGEFVISPPAGPTSDTIGFLSKVALVSRQMTFQERRDLANAMYAI